MTPDGKLVDLMKSAITERAIKPYLIWKTFSLSNVIANPHNKHADEETSQGFKWPELVPCASIPDSTCSVFALNSARFEFSPILLC